ncbi:MAG: hypothetical protein ACLGH8_14930 [Bacteroidia bacterium]
MQQPDYSGNFTEQLIHNAMKKKVTGILCVLTFLMTFAVLVSCRENNTGVTHHSESKSQGDNPVDNPSMGPESDSTPTGMDNRVPAQSSDTVGNNQGSVSPPPARP